MKDKLAELKMKLEEILKLDYPTFEKIILDNLKEINNLWKTLEKTRKRIKENTPDWVLN